MMDPFLNYINQVLMEDDATCMQQDAHASYQAIVSSFYDIIGEHCPPNSSLISARSEYKISSCHEEGPGEHDTKVSSCGEDAVVGKQQVNGPFKLPATDQEFNLKLTNIDISFHDLKLDSVYEALYVEEPSFLSSARRPATGSGRNRDKKKSLAVAGTSGTKSGNKGSVKAQGFVDLSELLVSCAQSVAAGDMRRANEILQELRQVHGASATGSSCQRAAHYFGEALVARMRGTGGDQCRDLTHNMPSAVTLLKVVRLSSEVTPFSILEYVANQSILKAAEGASRLHIVDCGQFYGMQWPLLINALADRKGGPPSLVITAVQFLQLGNNPAQRPEETGRRLAAYARTYRVPFGYHVIADSKWEDLDPASFYLHDDEVLVVNCMNCLHRFAGEGIDLASTISPRQKLLTCMRNLNPHLLLFADFSAACDSPFFVSRFREALYFYSNGFDLLDNLWGDSPERVIIETRFYSRGIVNIVACEGAERVERLETYKQWQACIKRAGFEQLPFPPTILSRSRSHLKQHYHKDFMLYDDANGWLLLGWKGRAQFVLSAWKPSPMYRYNLFAGADAPCPPN